MPLANSRRSKEKTNNIDLSHRRKKYQSSQDHNLSVSLSYIEYLEEQ